MSLKKILSSVLAATMVLSTMSFNVFANEVPENAVAKLDGTDIYFEVIADAFDPVNNPEQKQVVLIKNCEQDVVIDKGGYYSFYLNGYTLTGMLKIIDGTMNLYGKLPSSDGTGIIQNTGLNGEYAVYLNQVNSSTNLNISNCNFKATEPGGTAIYADGQKINIQSNVTVEGNVETAGFGVINISEGTFNGDMVQEAGSAINISGGYFSDDVSDIIGAGYTTVIENGMNKVVVKETDTIDYFEIDAEGAYLIEEAYGLKLFRTLLSTSGSKAAFSGKTFKVVNDIDLNNEVLPPAGNDKNRFAGTFDGGNFTISNLNIDGGSSSEIGFIGNLASGAVVKNVKFNNVTVSNGGRYVAAVAGYARSCTIDNCSVTGNINIEGGHDTAGILGGGVSKTTNCVVSGTGTIKGDMEVGGIIGLISAGSASVSNNTVNGVKLESNGGRAGGIAGIVRTNTNEAVVENNIVSSVEIISTDAPSALIVGCTAAADGNKIDYINNTATESTIIENGVEKDNLYHEDDMANSNIKVAVAMVNDTPYYLLADAVKNANGSEIKVLVDVTLDKMNYKDVTINLNGNKLTLANETVTSFNADKFYANNVVFKNGELDLAGEVMLNTRNVTLNDIDVDIVRNNIVPFYVNKDSVLRIENGSSISISGTAASAFSGDGYQTAKIEVDNSSVEIDGTQKAYHAGAVVLTNGATFDVSNISGSALNSVDITVVDSSLTVSNVSYHGITNSVLTVDNGTVEVDGCGYYGLNLYEGSSIADNSTVTVSDSGTTNGCSVKLNGSLTVNDSVFTAETIMNPSYINADEDSTVVVKANQIKVEFIETEESKTAEGYKIYDINLVGVDNTTINRLTSADLTFENNSVLAADNTKKVPYTISVDGLATADGMSVEKTADNRYMFNFDGVTQPDETDTEITIGQVRFDGYGSLDFKVNATAVDEAGNASNVVNATKTADSIVEHFIIGGGTADNIGELVVNEDAGEFGVIDDTEIAVPSRNLTINVTFPNAVDANVAAYQDMQVVISGGDITPATADTFKYALGEDMTTDGKYVVNAELTKGRTYTVTVSGAGYRTFAYDVTMDNAKDTVKELTFWNNVMDTPKVVEKDNDDSTETITFLAGDIVKDDNINIYDLSAVVSYFATPTDTNTADDNRQYDLNRDGMIDSKDVAYVLVSWGK